MVSPTTPPADAVAKLLLPARAAIRAGDLSTAAELAAKVQDLHPDRFEPSLLIARFAMRHVEHSALATPCVERLLKDFPERPESAAVLEELAVIRPDDAAGLASTLDAAGSIHPVVARFVAQQKIRRGDFAGAHATALRSLMDHRPTVSHFPLAMQLLHLGDRAVVTAWINHVRATGALDDADETLRARFAEFARSQPIEDDPATNVTVHRSGTAATVLLVFCGLDNVPGVPDEQLLSFVDDLPLHVVILRDPYLLGYLKGVPGLGDTLSETVTALRKLTAELGASRILCFGNSAGVFGALRYGAELDADGILGTSPVTRVTAEALRGDGRAGAVVERALAAVQDEMMDMRQVLLGRSVPVPVELHYGALMAIDAGHAEHLAQVPGVTLHPVEGVKTHGLLRLLNKTGEARALVRGFVMRRLP